jgi:hypothetical protein
VNQIEVQSDLLLGKIITSSLFDHRKNKRLRHILPKDLLFGRAVPYKIGLKADHIFSPFLMSPVPDVLIHLKK